MIMIPTESERSRRKKELCLQRFWLSHFKVKWILFLKHISLSHFSLPYFVPFGEISSQCNNNMAPWGSPCWIDNRPEDSIQVQVHVQPTSKNAEKLSPPAVLTMFPDCWTFSWPPFRGRFRGGPRCATPDPDGTNRRRPWCWAFWTAGGAAAAAGYCWRLTSPSCFGLNFWRESGWKNELASHNLRYQIK